METHWTDFDYIIVGVMVFSCVFAYFRGLVREILSLAAWIGAGIVTIYYFPSATAKLQTHFKSAAVAASIAGVGIYLLALIAFGLVNMIIIKSFKSSSEAGMLDNLLGLCFGFCRGALMVSLGFFLLTAILQGREYPDWLKESVTRPYVEKGAAVLAKVAPDALLEISTLERGTLAIAAPETVADPGTNTNNPGINDQNNPGQSPPNQDTGYNRTTTQQLDRLIDSTGKQ